MHVCDRVFVRALRCVTGSVAGVSVRSLWILRSNCAAGVDGSI